MISKSLAKRYAAITWSSHERMRQPEKNKNPRQGQRRDVGKEGKKRIQFSVVI